MDTGYGAGAPVHNVTRKTVLSKTVSSCEVWDWFLPDSPIPPTFSLLIPHNSRFHLHPAPGAPAPAAPVPTAPAPSAPVNPSGPRLNQPSCSLSTHTGLLSSYTQASCPSTQTGLLSDYTLTAPPWLHTHGSSLTTYSRLLPDYTLTAPPCLHTHGSSLSTHAWLLPVYTCMAPPWLHMHGSSLSTHSRLLPVYTHTAARRRTDGWTDKAPITWSRMT